MRKILGVVLLLLLISLTTEAAKIISVEGTPEILTPLSTGWQPARKGTALSSNDRVRCKTGARAEILLDDGHRIKLWPKSEIALEKIDSGSTMISLAIGRLRSLVKKLRTREKFEVKTPVAVCSVRGTDFSVELTEDNKSVVEVYEGVVAAREEKTGSEVLVNRGEYTQIRQNQPPAEPEALPGDTQSREGGASIDADAARAEARNEIFQEISREAVLARAAEEIKLAEYQNGKAVIDAFGNRVRLEEYILRTQPNEFKYVVLNNREDRFDFGKMIFTFNTTLPGDLTQATKTMFHSDGPTKPQWWLTDVLSVMSNTVDQVNEEASGGAMYADNPSSPRSWSLGFSKYTFSVNNQAWWDYSDANSNGRIDASEISYYNIATGNKISMASDFQYDSAAGKYYLLDANSQKVYFNEYDQPGGEEAFRFYQRSNYTLTQWISAEDYVIDDSGKTITLADLQNKTSAELEKKAYESNFERVYISSVFNGRKIDLVFSAKLLIDAGILNIPQPKSMN